MAEDFKDARAPDAEDNGIRETVAANITKYRQKLGLSRAALAAKIGVTETAIGQYERGVRTPQVEILCKLADVFSITVDELIDHGTDESDAVLEWRFSQACRFLSDFCYFVYESQKGVSICRWKGKKEPKLTEKNGVISIGLEDEIEIVVTLDSKETLVLLISYLHHAIFERLPGQTLKDLLIATRNAEKYYPDIYIEYFGNAHAPTQNNS